LHTDQVVGTSTFFLTCRDVTSTGGATITMVRFNCSSQQVLFGRPMANRRQQAAPIYFPQSVL
jgi:hypothetical protein